MRVILDPQMIFTSERHWNDPVCRDLFLGQLDKLLLLLSDLQIASVVWSDDLESQLWSAPSAPPWRLDKDWGNQLVPSLYRRLSKLAERIDNINPCSGNFGSGLICEHISVDSFVAFELLFHEALLRFSSCYLCSSWFTCRQSATTPDPRCNCVMRLSNVDVLYKSEELLQRVDFPRTHWPTGWSNPDVEKFRVTLRLFSEQLGIDISQPLRGFSFTERFFRSIVSEVRNRRHILEAMVLRISLSQGDAARNEGLHDEQIDENVYRFRVTGASRIHYRFSDDQERIIFDEYFGEGQHDLGLR